jgi:ribose 5-phosphate isomerase B
MRREIMASPRSLFFASDHAAFLLKQDLIYKLEQSTMTQWDIHDLGPYTDARCNYPEYAWKLACQVANTKDSLGVLLCGTGIGVSMAANRHPDIRAALVHNVWTAQMAREHNNAQVICLGARVIGSDLAWAMVERFLQTDFMGGRHAQRVDQMQVLTVRSSVQPSVHSISSQVD